jgi:hypothetical protein
VITADATKAKQPSHVAVAYFGALGPTLLPLKAGSTLVVDASVGVVGAGMTNPYALDLMLKRGVNVFSVRNLHAKVFAFDKSGFIGSTNVSSSSANVLVEASFRTTLQADIAAIRKFVTGLAINQLDAKRLAALKTIYKPPKVPRAAKAQQPFSGLIMDITKEQGPGRRTQVQPPAAVWEIFFGLKAGSGQPVLTLRSGVGVRRRKVVKHTIVRTIEIPEAAGSLPAIIEMTPTGKNAYRYRVVRPPDPDFASLDALLANVSNPLQRGKRRWLTI